MRRRGRTLVIPASIRELSQWSFRDVASIRAVQFEAGSQVQRLERGTFGGFQSLRSICIAASVEFIGKKCFIDDDSSGEPYSFLETVTFEPKSKLREIAAGAFAYCEYLKKLVIPASVEKMSGASLPDEVCQIELESGNPHFEVHSDFLIDLKHHFILRYLGRASDIPIPDEIEKIDDGCFRDCKWVSQVRFGPSARLSSIGRNAFYSCKGVKVINIPSSVTCLGDYCFGNCESLHTVTFCAGSTLKCIPDSAFTECHLLESITVPSTVTTLGGSCFSGCYKLAHSPMPIDSEVVRIENLAFSGCSSLTSLFLPSSVQFVGPGCFEGCRALLAVTFGSPSNLRELLDFPPLLSGFAAIPDSVESLALSGISQYERAHRSPERALTFGIDSRLSEVRERSSLWYKPSPSFLHISTRSLKLLRMKSEFKTGSQPYGWP
jgi:hypothetical protein